MEFMGNMLYGSFFVFVFATHLMNWRKKNPKKKPNWTECLAQINSIKDNHKTWWMNDSIDFGQHTCTENDRESHRLVAQLMFCMLFEELLFIAHFTKTSKIDYSHWFFGTCTLVRCVRGLMHMCLVMCVRVRDRESMENGIFKCARTLYTENMFKKIKFICLSRYYSHY